MKTFSILLCLSSALTSTSFAESCPNLTGKFLNLESTTEYVNYDEFKQTGCTEVDLQSCSVLTNGHLLCSDFIVKWDLVGGKAYLRGEALPGRTVTFTTTSITIHDSGNPSRFNVVGHGMCTMSNDFSYSIDANNNLIFTNTLSNCADGFSGNVNDVLKRI